MKRQVTMTGPRKIGQLNSKEQDSLDKVRYDGNDSSFT